MNLRQIRTGRGLSAFILGSALGPMASAALAGGHHHHQQTFFVPVQTVGVQTVQVQAAPVQFAPVVAAAPTMQFVQAPVAAAPTVQLVQAPVAAAPVMQFVQAPVAAAPTVQVVQAPVAAAPTVQLVQAPVAAAPTMQLAQAPVAAPKASAPVAAAPQASVDAFRYTFNGASYKLVPADAASAPTVGKAPEDDRTAVQKELALFVTKYKALNLDASTLRIAVRSKAADLYGTITGNDATSADASQQIERITDEALDGTSATSQSADSTPATGSTATPAVQQVLVPVAAPAATMQLFLPVKTKHHGHGLLH